MSRAARRLQWKSLRQRFPRDVDGKRQRKPTWGDFLQWEANQLRAAVSREKRT